MADEEVIPKRFQRRQDRLQQMRSLAPQRVRVNPRDDGIRRVLRHPASGGFLSEGSTEWPLDQFTKRRLREGSISLEAAKPDTADKREKVQVTSRAAAPGSGAV